MFKAMRLDTIATWAKIGVEEWNDELVKGEKLEEHLNRCQKKKVSINFKCSFLIEKTAVTTKFLPG